MIRKAIIVVLTLGAVGAAVVGVQSHERILRTRIRCTDRDWVYIHFWDGVGRIFWFTSDDAFSLDSREPRARFEQLEVKQGSTHCRLRVAVIVSSDDLHSWGRRIHYVEWLRKMRSRSGECSPVYRSFIRTPVWTVLGVFAAYPIIALIGFIRGPVRRWRRRRVGFCLKCGYDLTGNVTGVCPECGGAV